MARISTGKTPAAKGKSATPPPKTSTRAKTAATPPKKKATTALQVKAAATKKAPASARPGSAKPSTAKSGTAKPGAAKSGSGQVVASGTVTGRRPAAVQHNDIPKRSADRRQSAVRESSAAKPTVTRKAAGESPNRAAKQTTAKMTPPPKTAATPRAPQASKSTQPARAAAKTVSVKVVAPRRPASRTQLLTPGTRRARPVTPPRKSALPQKITATAPQTFTVSHLRQTDFKPDGLRTYAHYRDLGIAAATGGLCQAHVIRFIPPCTDEVRKRHQHKADLQLIYVLQGWMKNEFEGHGQQMMSAGSCWLQPSGIKHTVLDYSADCEVLEIIIPADFETQELP